MGALLGLNYTFRRPLLDFALIFRPLNLPYRAGLNVAPSCRLKSTLLVAALNLAYCAGLNLPYCERS
jgi:hypothetical protein